MYKKIYKASPELDEFLPKKNISRRQLYRTNNKQKRTRSFLLIFAFKNIILER